MGAEASRNGARAPWATLRLRFGRFAEELDQPVRIIRDDAVDAGGDQFLHLVDRIGRPGDHPKIVGVGFGD